MTRFPHSVPLREHAVVAMPSPVSNTPSGRSLRLVRGREQGRGFDPSDFDQVFRRFAPYVARIGMRLLGSTHELEDLVQDVFVDVHGRLHQLRDPERLRAWLARVTVRKAVRRLRRHRLRRWLSLEQHPDYLELADPEATPEQRAELISIYRVLERASAEERVVWLLRFGEGLSLDEVAETCGLSKSTVQRRLRGISAQLSPGVGHG